MTRTPTNPSLILPLSAAVNSPIQSLPLPPLPPALTEHSQHHRIDPGEFHRHTYIHTCVQTHAHTWTAPASWWGLGSFSVKVNSSFCSLDPILSPHEVISPIIPFLPESLDYLCSDTFSSECKHAFPKSSSDGSGAETTMTLSLQPHSHSLFHFLPSHSFKSTEIWFLPLS